MKLTLTMGALPFSCLFVVGDKQYAQNAFKEVGSKYKLREFNWEMHHNGARTFTMPCGDTMIWMKEWHWPRAIHELFHVVAWVMAKVKTPLIDDTEEMYAYHLQHLTQQLLDHVATVEQGQKRQAEVDTPSA